MKIQFIEPNTVEAYDPSRTTLTLKNEQNRILRAEVFDWDINFIPRLSELCVQILGKNFLKYAAPSNVLYCDQIKILDVIPTNLELENIINLIHNEGYWKRRYEDHFPLKDFKKHPGWTWKCVYLEHYISIFCENAEPQYKDEESINHILELCSPYVHILSITKMTAWDFPRTSISNNSRKKPDMHINFLPILSRLPNITELSLCFAPILIKDTFDFHIFRMCPEDGENLVNAIMCLPLLTILKIRRSWVDDKCLQKIVQKLIKNDVLVELDLSYCNIGDNGAKYLAHLMMVHETLKTLILRGNCISTEGCNGIAWAFMNPEPNRIQSVDLGLNPIGDEGVINLLKALVRSEIPRQLSLAGCSIKENAHFVGKMLAINDSLQILDISSNEFDESAGQAILNAVEVNKRLTQINMRDTGIPKKKQKEINEILKKNLVMCPNKKSNINLDFVKSVIKSLTTVSSFLSI